MTATVKPLRWGIIGTGSISTKFSQDLLVDPESRGVSDVAHVITAVGSRSVDSAQDFIDRLKKATSSESWSWGVKQGKLDRCKAYGTYEAVYNDENVDVVYVGTPHTLHHRNTKDALLAGKHVLCEKPFTLDLAELDELIALAEEKKCFLMEAVWTRFHPLSYAVQELLRSGELGRPRRFAADFSMDFKPDSRDTTSRMIDPAVGGGSLLDQGPYPCVWAMLLVHQHPLNHDKTPKVVNSHQTTYRRSGVDLNSRWVVEWDGLLQADLKTDMDCPGLRDNTAVLQCEEGDLMIAYPPYRSETFHIVPRPERYVGTIQKPTTHHHPIAAGNNGMSYEADETARCIRDGLLESPHMSWEESRIVQGWFDQVRTSGPSATRNLKGTAGQ